MNLKLKVVIIVLLAIPYAGKELQQILLDLGAELCHFAEEANVLVKTYDLHTETLYNAQFAFEYSISQLVKYSITKL